MQNISKVLEKWILILRESYSKAFLDIGLPHRFRGIENLCSPQFLGMYSFLNNEINLRKFTSFSGYVWVLKKFEINRKLKQST